MLPRMGNAKQKPLEEPSHSGLQATCWQRREGGSQSPTTHWCNLRLKRSKRCRIKGLVCVCRHPCLMVQLGFQLLSTLKAEVYLHVVWKGCRHRLKDQRERFSSIVRSESGTASDVNADLSLLFFLSPWFGNPLFIIFNYSLVSFTLYVLRVTPRDGPFPVFM